MTELELYKFIHDNNIEYRWQPNELGKDEVMIFPYTFQLNDFYLLIKKSCTFDDGGVPMNLRDGYVAIWMGDICDYAGIEMENVFTEKSNR